MSQHPIDHIRQMALRTLAADGNAGNVFYRIRAIGAGLSVDFIQGERMVTANVKMDEDEVRAALDRKMKRAA